MSYEIRFKVKVDGTDKYVTVGDCGANITCNVRKIIEMSTGLPWHNTANNGYCLDVIPCIAKGYAELLWHPDKYKRYEPSNGWGTVEGTIQFFREILDAWAAFVLDEDHEVVKMTTFWIV